MYRKPVVALDLDGTLGRLLSRAEPDIDGCLIYTFGADLSGGYGQFKVGMGSHDVKCPWGISAHRASWWLQKGDIPPGKSVLHHCDKRRCILISCLFIGTARDNTRDMMAKGRQGWPDGSKWNEVITDEHISRWVSGERAGDIAREIGCHPMTISKMARDRGIVKTSRRGRNRPVRDPNV